MRISLKFWFLRHYWWLLPLAFTPLAGGVVVVGHGVDFRLLLTIVGTLLSLIYFLQTQRVQEVKLFREIFAECNRRYDELSERLNAIRNEPIDQPLNREELGTLMKYLDLCGEE